MALCSVSYKYMENHLGINAYIYFNDEAVASFVYERTVSEPRSEEVNGCLISYYSNHEEGELSAASWIIEKVHYHVEGNLNDEELRRIVHSLIEE